MLTCRKCSKAPPGGVQPGNSELTLMSTGPVEAIESVESIVREKVPGAVILTVPMGDPAP